MVDVSDGKEMLTPSLRTDERSQREIIGDEQNSFSVEKQLNVGGCL